MKYILLLLITTSLYGQKLTKTPYEIKMEKQAIANFNITMFNPTNAKERILIVKPYKWVKLTIKSGLNQSAAGDMLMTGITSGIDQMLDGMTMDDYSSLGKYDVRVKFYLNKKVRLLNRVTGAGFNGGNLGYSSGFIIKF